MKLRLAILAYAKDAVFDHLDDGGVATFDAVTARIVGGPRDGETLRILVDPADGDASRWDRPGETLDVSIATERLDGQIPFAAAFAIGGEG